MAQQTINPYAMLGLHIQPGLNAIIAGLPGTPTVDDLVTEVYNYIVSTFYPSPSSVVTIEIKSVAYNVINSIRNSLVLSGNAFYNEAQFPLINLLIGGGTVNANIPSNSFLERVDDINENIGTFDLTVDEQTPLFIASTMGSNSYKYWSTEIANPQSSWVTYFNSNAGANFINTPIWAMEAMNGALAGYGASPRGLISPSTDAVSVQMVSALIGALTATAGKLIFNWIPRVSGVNKITVSKLKAQDGGNEPSAITIIGVGVGTWILCGRTHSNRHKCDTEMHRCDDDHR